jgi:hypothetical protein
MLRKRRVTIRSIVFGFAHAVESRALDAFWRSRKKGNLVTRPEKIGQALFASYALGVLGGRKSSLVLREIKSGIGFVDLGVILGSGIHLIEMKVITSKFTGASQLEAYMKTENRKYGWLVFFDSRPIAARRPVPTSLKTPAGTIMVVGIDINPAIPCRTN